MDRLDALGMIEPLQHLLTSGARPFLGICVGMQILCDIGFEFKEYRGLGIVKGKVEILTNTFQEERLILPHIGWNQVEAGADSVLFSDSSPEELEFYFLHSYHLVPKEGTAGDSHTQYGAKFVSALERDNVFAVQFHPEKSQRNGSRILQKFSEI